MFQQNLVALFVSRKCAMKLMQTHMKNKLTYIEICSDISDKKEFEETETNQCEFCEK